ncbi:MAG: hypothetical protein QOI51_2094 [Nocardioidaceae bacterium]|nr:hypothetical protein [Nocardioidaceae bacterium]
MSESSSARIEPHRARGVAESFGVDAERYDRTRQRYPDELVRRIVATGPDVLDVGCGTGIAARQFEAAGATVLGVEPDPRMAQFARRGGIDVEVARFEAWEAAGRTFDAVVAATAWHWVDPVAGAAKAAQVLRPDGRFAAFWHAFEPPDSVSDAFAVAFRRVAPDSPFAMRTRSAGQPRTSALEQYQLMCATAADGLREVGGFTEAEQWRFDWARPYTRAEWLDQLPTTGPLTQLPPDELAEVLTGVGAAVDAIGGSFTVHYATVVATATRRVPA